jgi:hypothetical protein
MELQGVATDSAGPGKAAEATALKRQLLVEAAATQGHTVVQLLWDVEAFFDSMDIEKLVTFAQRWGMPPHASILELQQHLAPRALQIDGCFAPLIDKMGRSMLAGCTSSTRFARAFLRDCILQAMSGTVKAVGMHVDDVAQLFADPSRSTAKESAIRQGATFATSLMKLGFTISPKSVVVSSCWETAKKVASAIHRMGIPMTAVVSADDLGVTASGGKRRIVEAMRKWICKGTRRIGRVKVLPKSNAKAKVLYKTGVKPQQWYGICCMGASPSLRKKARRAAVMCGGNTGWRPCYTTALCLQGGMMHDPEVELQVKQVGTWLDLWWDVTVAEKEELTCAWRKIRDELTGAPESKRWARVAGPIAATVTTLLELGWQPLQPDFWLSTNRTQAAVRDTAQDETAILECVRRTARRKTWVIASKHWGGRGLEQGEPDFTAFQKLKKKLLKDGAHAGVAALTAVVTGSVRFGSRLGGANRVCPHCSMAAEEDAKHRYYECPSLAELYDPEKIRSKPNWLKAKARTEEWKKHECLLARGILPASFALTAKNDDAEPEPETMHLLGTFREAASSSEMCTPMARVARAGSQS